MVTVYFMSDPAAAAGADRPLGSSAAEHIVLTWQSDPRTTVSITWRTSPDVRDTVVEYVPSDRFAGFPSPESTVVRGTSFLFTTDLGTMAVHEAQLTGLKPGTSYIYRVGDGRAGHWSEPYRFQTEPGKAEPFTFLFMSDTQAFPNRSAKNGYGIWAEMLGLGLRAFPESRFLLLSGDIVDYGDQQQQWELWFAAAEQMLPSIPLVPTVGNHDVVRSGEENFRAQFQLPRNGPETETELAYSFDYGDMHMAILNTEGDLKAQADWLLRDMRASGKKWKIVAFHRSPYHSHSSRANKDVRDAWTGIFDQAGVDLVLSGHDHVYMRSWPLRGGNVVPDGEGTTYVIGGTGGSKFYDMGQYPWMRVTFDEKIQIVSSVTIDGDRLSMHVLTRDGRVADAFTIVKGGATIPGFRDLPATHWAYRTIQSLHKAGIVNGVTETSFAPEQPVTRAEFAAMLARAMGWKQPSAIPNIFVDVYPNDWFANDVYTVYEHRIAQGVDDRHFAPKRNITREEMAVMIVNAYELSVPGLASRHVADQLHRYADRERIASWSAASVNKALHYGLMNGTPDGRFAPERSASRAEAAQVIYRLLESVRH
jgi:hypothetical protein